MILLPLLVLILRNHLQDPAGQTPPEGFKYAYYEVIIPKKVTPRYGLRKSTCQPQHINYWLQIEGKGNLVHLRQKKGITPKQFPVFTYSKEGTLQVDYPFVRDDCYYHGFVQDKPSSLAALTTCSGGLRGILRLDNKTYEIIPIQPSATFQHVVYRLEQKEDAVTMSCGLTEEERRRQDAMMHGRKKKIRKIYSRGKWWSHTRYIKNAVVVDYNRYIQFGSNDTLVTMRVMEIIHISNSFYLPLAVNLSLIGLEIWTKQNLITISVNGQQALTAFNRWCKHTLLKRLPNDVAHLLVYQRFGSRIGLAGQGTICWAYQDFSIAIVSYLTSVMFFVSNTFTHELGHVLGMSHDKPECTCNSPFCIMAAQQTNTDKFSNCSYAEYFTNRDSFCMFIPPDPEKMYKLEYCGNKIVEKGEQCDCGSKSECDSNPCCQNNCRLRPSASCALGICCDNCSFLPAGTLCRNVKSTCDLPEYCNGTSEWCPKDLYVQNGAPCKDGTYCYKGSCSTHYDQCQEIFGRKAIAASEECFRTVNIQGDRFGNCGLMQGIYQKCMPNNTFCGRIQCENVDHLLVDEHRTVIQTPIGNKICWGTDYHSGMKLTDTGAVKDGIPCSTDKMCISGECTSVSLLKYDCDATKCHNHGKCNNLKHCHCDEGWAPPDCQMKGYGGSIDSGPPPEQAISNDSNDGSGGGGGGDGDSGGSGGSGSGGSSSTHAHRNLSVKIGIIVFFILATIILAGLAVYYRKKLKDWLRTKFKNLRSTNSEKSRIKQKSKIKKKEMEGKEEKTERLKSQNF